MKPRDLVSWISLVVLFARCAAAVIVAVLPLAVDAAQPTAAGAIQGRILNPASGEYVRNAQVRVQGAENLAVSEVGTAFRFAGKGTF